jgi:alanyl-tRNA synthetase
MTSKEIRQKFLDFFVSKGHTLVPSSSLIPDDPSVLLTTAGMQQFKPYYAELDPISTVHPSIGKPIGRAACSVQKCFRTSDIDEVGDERHLTFFEMLGNFSFGGYFKKEAIAYAHEFITKVMGLRISYVTIFRGSDAVPKDEESKAIWNSLGVMDVREEGMEDVFWGPTGNGGPCGPTTEIYCKNAVGKDIEVWNIVFNEFVSTGSREDLLVGKAQLKRLEHPGVDTGMGLERLVMISQNEPSVFATDLFNFASGVNPGGVGTQINLMSRRIVSDHIRSAVFLLADGVIPSNKDRGYILRRLIRRALVNLEKDLIFSDEHSSKADPNQLVEAVISQYEQAYPELRQNQSAIYAVFNEEQQKFSATLKRGISELQRKYPVIKGLHKTVVVGAEAFDLKQSYGLPKEAIRDLLSDQGHLLDDKAFDAAEDEHKQISKAGASGKFGGHGLVMTGELKAGNDEEVKTVTRLHTATHLLHTALRKVLGNEVKQMGSDITPERLRFDFAYPRKLTGDELIAIEKAVNDEIKKGDAVAMKEMKYADAVASGALAFFKGKYPETVKVYSIGDYSKEVCGGPHVANSAEVGEFKIIKEEAVSAGVRRIRAVVK